LHLQISHVSAAKVDCACVFIIDGDLYYANVQMAKCCIAKGAKEHAATVIYACISTIANALNTDNVNGADFFRPICPNSFRFSQTGYLLFVQSI